jgi:hypothetical protein
MVTKGTADGVVAHANYSIGAGISSTERACMSVCDEDGQTTQDCNRWVNTTDIIHLLVEGSGSADLVFADLVSLDSAGGGGFTIDIYQTLGAAHRCTYLALGGTTLTDVAIGKIDLTAATGEESWTGVGFQPDAMMFFNNGDAVSSGADSSFGLGFAASSSETGFIHINGDNGNADSDNYRWMEQNAVFAMCTKVGGIDHEATLTSFDTDGFTVNWSNAPFDTDDIIYIAFEGVTASVGTVTSQTSTGTWSETGLGFQPSAGFFISQMAAHTAEYTTDSRMSIGVAASPTEQSVMGVMMEHNQATMDTDSFHDDGLIYQSYDHAQTLTGSADLDSWDTGGFTLNMIDADPSAYEIMYMVFDGDDAGTEYTSTPSGSAGLAGVAVKKTSASQVGSIAPAGSPVRQTSKVFAGALGIAGVMAFLAAVTFAGSVGLSGVAAGIKTALQWVTGSVFLSGTVKSRVGKGLSGVLGLAVALNKYSERVFAGTVGLSGIAAGIKATFQVVAGTLTSAGALVRQAEPVLAGAVGLAGVVSTIFGKVLAGAVGLAGAITTVGTFFRSVAGTVGMSGAILRLLPKSVAGVLQLIGAGVGIGPAPFERAVGTFALRTTTGSQSVTGLGFTPKVVIVSVNYMTTDGVTEHAAVSLGCATSSTDEWCIHFNAEDGVAASDTVRGQYNNRFLYMTTQGGTTTHAVTCDFTSMDSDGFTFNVSDATGATAYRAQYLALGGSDLTDVVTGTLTTTTSATQSVTGLSFQPDAILLAWNSHTANANANNMVGGFGFATASDEEAFSAWADDSGTNPTLVWNYQENDAVVGSINYGAGGIDFEADLTSLNSDGFTLNFSNVPTAGESILYLALKGVRMHVGEVTTQTSTGTWSETAPGWMPKAGIFMSGMAAASASVNQGSKFSLGFAADSNQASLGFTNEDNVTPSDADSWSDDASIYNSYDYAQTKTGTVTLDSWDSTGFTLNQTDADPGGYELLYFVFAPVLDPVIEQVVAGVLALAGGATGIKMFLQAVAGVLGLAGVGVMSAFSRLLTGTLGLAGATSKLVATSMVGALGLAAALVGSFTTSQLVAGAIGLAGLVVRNTSKLNAGTLALAGTALKDIFVSVAGSLTPTGVAAGVRVFYSVAAGAVGFAGVAIGRMGKGLTGSITPSATLVRDISFNVAGVLTPAGAMVRKALLVLAGTLGLSVGMVASLRKSFGGAVGLAGAMYRQTQKQWEPWRLNAIYSAGTLNKLSTHSLVGAFGMAGNAAKTTLFLFSGALGLAGSMGKGMYVSLVGSVGTAGAVLKQIPANLAGTLGLAGNGAKKMYETLVGTLGLSGVGTGLVIYLQVVAGVISASGAMVLRAGKATAGSVSAAGAVTTVRTFVSALAGTLGLAGAKVATTWKVVAGSTTPTGGFSRIVSLFRSPTGTVGLSGTTSKLSAMVLSGALSLSNALVRSVRKPVAGAVGLASTISKFTTYTIAGTVSMSGSIARSTLRAIAGALVLAGEVLKVWNVPLDVATTTAARWLISITDTELYSVAQTTAVVNSVDISTVSLNSVSVSTSAVTTVAITDSSRG